MVLKVLKQEWWLDESALPDLLWARLNIYGDHHLEVLDLDGVHHPFTSEEAARHWLHEEEYRELQGLIKDGAVPASTRPPSADSDQVLVSRMRVLRAREAPTIVPAVPGSRRRGLNVPLLLAATFIAFVIMALKNSQTCVDEASSRWLQSPGGPTRTLRRLPCDLKCCGDSPWACRCSRDCPCFQHPAHAVPGK